MDINNHTHARGHTYTHTCRHRTKILHLDPELVMQLPLSFLRLCDAGGLNFALLEPYARMHMRTIL
jgi:hypothetical protein